MPEARTLRAMAYAAVVHGATGLIYFAFDSFVTRDDGILGIAPAPRSDYGVTVDYNLDGKAPLIASDAALDRSRKLFGAVAELNVEMAALREAILSPTSSVEYTVRPTREVDRSNAVRTLLKQTGGANILIAVNVDNDPATVKFRFSGVIEKVEPYFGSAFSSDAGADGWTERFEPDDVKLYRIVFAP